MQEHSHFTPLTRKMSNWEVAQILAESYRKYGLDTTMKGYDETKRRVNDAVKWVDSAKEYPEAKLELCNSRKAAIKHLKLWLLDQECINYPTEGTENFIHGNFFDNEIPDNYAHIIECDPPYGVKLNTINRPRRLFGMRKYVEVEEEDYSDFISRLIRECYRIGKEDSWLILWHSEQHYSMVVEKLNEAGYVIGYNRGIWVKPSNFCYTTNPETRLGCNYEMFFYARKGKPYINRMGRPDVFTYTGVPHVQVVRHPTERPIGLIEDILTTFAREGSMVVCPFGGSGNTLLAARRSNMASVGYEIIEEYINRYRYKYQEEVKNNG